ncbi:unnamed protein product [Echinostoma caproni]|uniref:IRS-type PTB domain-containing protein n=1 Tax=Echinostoma caproni TaxID=27848 RepID=A0A183A6N6_9TREM|nr:unnamed protein product [Echinostoma caproni]
MSAFTLSRKNKVEKNCFALLFLDAIEVNYYERINPKRIKDHLIRKARRQQLNDQMGPVKLTVLDDHLELNKALWWPNTDSHSVSHNQLRDVFPLELDGKKFLVGVVNTETRQRRVLIFKAKSSGECEKIVDLLDKYRQQQNLQSFESDTMASTNRDSQISMKQDSPISYRRPSSAVSFARTPSAGDFPESAHQYELRKSRLQPMERGSLTMGRESSGRNCSFARESYSMEGDTAPAVMKPKRLYRTPIHSHYQQDVYERPASTLPGDSSHSTIVARPPAQPIRSDRTALHVGTIRRTPVLPDYVNPDVLQRSTSVQSFPANPNGVSGYVQHEGYYYPQGTSYINEQYDPTRRQSNAIHINIHASPGPTSNDPGHFASFQDSDRRASSRMQSTSPTLPPGYEMHRFGEQIDQSYDRSFDLKNDFIHQNNEHMMTEQNTLSLPKGLYRVSSESGLVDLGPRSPKPIIIVRETEQRDADSLTNSIASQRTENHTVRFVDLNTDSRPQSMSVKSNPGTMKRVHYTGDHTSSTEEPNETELTCALRISVPHTEKKHYIQEVTILPGHKQQLPPPPPPQQQQQQQERVITYTGNQPVTDNTQHLYGNTDTSNQNSLNRIRIMNVENPATKSVTCTVLRHDTNECNEMGSHTMYLSPNKSP